ncbi:hypothetical protein ILUMI_02951 [Ignelater luminosus]|uniref:Uncharacterized protein n=1 Tax=Ignelater luminosus TaxID=2038154 RepID=A0A8K0GIT6_IGNLU|nr:hypothetical protein ILUMI_02951 [Ignelater luminosus]
MDKTTLRVSISLRLGREIYKPHKCSCRTLVDTRHPRNTYLAKKVVEGVVDIQQLTPSSKRLWHLFSSILEPVAVGLMHEDGKRPDGLTLVPWRKGRFLVWDATCLDTLAPSHIELTSKTVGAAADSRKE